MTAEDLQNSGSKKEIEILTIQEGTLGLVIFEKSPTLVARCHGDYDARGTRKCSWSGT